MLRCAHREDTAIISDGGHMLNTHGYFGEYELLSSEKCGQLQIIFESITSSCHEASVFGAAPKEQLTVAVNRCRFVMTCGQALNVHAIKTGKLCWDGYALIFDAETELTLKARAPDEGTILYGLIANTTWTKS